MLKSRYLVLAAVALGTAACASDPYYDDAYYSAPRYSSRKVSNPP